MAQTQSQKIAHANKVWDRTRRCTAFSFALGCTERINGVGLYREHGTYCAFGTRRSDGTRSESCFKTVMEARRHARGR
jgi:hypothetical protein